MFPSSSTVELPSIEPAVSNTSKDQSPQLQNSEKGHTSSEVEARNPENAVPSPERWNHPRRNTWRLATVFFAFINLGMNEASYGPLLPYIARDYHLNYTVASLVFLSPFIGYTLAALISDRLHLRFGRRGIAIISPCSKLLAFIVVSVHPPYPAVVVILAFAGFGNGLLDGTWNAWVGSMAQATQILGLLHGCYGVGAIISPVIATAMIMRYRLGWWEFFYLMTGLLAVELVIVSAAFWMDDGKAYRLAARSESGDEKGMTRLAVRKRTTWVAAIFVLVYFGAEVSTGGYIVLFMTQVRHGAPFPSGLTATGYWLGITVGRITLGFVTPKIGERLAVILYIFCAIGVELLFWLVPQFIVSAVAIALVGFFLGPLFPSVIVIVTRILPKGLHVASIAFSTTLGGSGAAVMPFMVGAIAQAKGVATLQPIILAILAVLLGIWLLFPALPKHRNSG